jgi:hypothetical protein
VACSSDGATSATANTASVISQYIGAMRVMRLERNAAGVIGRPRVV